MRTATGIGRDRKHRQAFTLIEIMIVCGLVGLVAAIAIPNFLKARATAQQDVCISNLRVVSGAIHQWALEVRAEEDSAVTYNDIHGYLRTSVFCPAGGTSFQDSYQISKVSAGPACLKVPAQHVLPSQLAATR